MTSEYINQLARVMFAVKIPTDGECYRVANATEWRRLSS